MITPDSFDDQPPAFYRRGSVQFFAVVIVLIVIAVCFGPRGFRDFKNWRAVGLAEKARTKMQQGDLQGAMDQARSAMILSPESIEARRTVAEILTVAREGSALGSWKQVMESPRATADDRRAALECAVGFGQAELAAEWLKPLMESAPGDSRNLLLAGKTALLNSQRPEALALGERAVAADAANLRAQLFLGSIDLMDAATRDTGVDRLFTLAAHDEAEGLAAAETLARVALTPDQAARVIARLRNHPQSSAPQKLLALALETQLHPDRRAALLDAAGAKYQKGEPKAFRDFCGWLNGNGEFTRVLTLVPVELAKTRKDLFLVWLDAQAGLKHWDEIREVLSLKPLPLEDMYVELYLARCADELGDETGSSLHWRRAQLAAQGNPQQALYLANYAEKQGQVDRATAAYQALADNPSIARGAYEGLLRLAQKRDTAAIAAVLDAMHGRWPADTAVQNDRVYYHLLLKRDVPEMVKAAEQLVQAEPMSMPHRTALALAYLRANDVARAAKVYDGLTVDWAKASTSAIAIYAAVLQAQKRDEMAATLMRQLKPQSLREEERSLLDGVN